MKDVMTASTVSGKTNFPLDSLSAGQYLNTSYCRVNKSTNHQLLEFFMNIIYQKLPERRLRKV